MLHDCDELADQRRPVGVDQPVEPERDEVVVLRPHGHDREIQSLVGDEEAVGVEVERGDVEQTAVDAVLIIELDLAGRGGLRVVQHMMVGHHQVRRDHRPGAIPDEPSAAVLDQDAPDRPGGGHAGVQKPRSDEIVGVDDGFEQVFGRRRFGHRGRVPFQRLLQQLLGRGGRRGLGQLIACVVAGDPVQPLGNAFRCVRLHQAGRRRERLLVLRPRRGALLDSATRGLVLSLLQDTAAQRLVAARIGLFAVDKVGWRVGGGHAGESPSGRRSSRG